jgi:hypothetical protein
VIWDRFVPCVPESLSRSPEQGFLPLSFYIQPISREAAYYGSADFSNGIVAAFRPR